VLADAEGHYTCGAKACKGNANRVADCAVLRGLGVLRAGGTEAPGSGEGFLGFIEAAGFLQCGAEIFAEIGIVGGKFDGA